MRKLFRILSSLLVGIGAPLFVWTLVLHEIVERISPDSPNSATGQVVRTLYKGHAYFMRAWESQFFALTDYLIMPFAVVLVLWLPLALGYRAIKGKWPDDDATPKEGLSAWAVPGALLLMIGIPTLFILAVLPR